MMHGQKNIKPMNPVHVIPSICLASTIVLSSHLHLGPTS